MPKNNNTKAVIVNLHKDKHKNFKNAVNDNDTFMQTEIENFIDVYIEDHEKAITKLKKSLKRKKK